MLATALALGLAPADGAAAECPWTRSGPPVVFENDLYGTLEAYLLRAKEGLSRRTPTLAGFAVLADTEAARIPGTLKNEGLVFDGKDAIFSWRYGLQRTDGKFRPVLTRPLAIPPDIQAAHYDAKKRNGFGHIGDIDLAGGKLYVPIEDEDNRTKPFIAVFDPKTLRYTGEKHLLPVEKLPHGVPWIAVDAPRGVWYTMDWDAKELTVFDLRTFAFVKTVPLSAPAGAPLERVQGGKVRAGKLYLSGDAKPKRLFEADPVTGEVRVLATYEEPDRAEAEGLAFGPDGALRVLVLAPYFYDARFPESFEVNDDDWNPSARLDAWRPGRCP